MAIAIDSINAIGTSGGSTTKSWTHTCTGTASQGMLVVIFNVTGFVSTSSVTYNGVAMTQAFARPQNLSSTAYYMKNPPAGAFTVLITLSGSSNSVSAYSVSLTGADEYVQPDSSSSGGATTTNATVTVATVKPHCFIFDIVCSSASGTATAVAGQTSVISVVNTSGYPVAGGYIGPYSTSGNKTHNYTVSSAGAWDMGAIAVREAVTTTPAVTAEGGGFPVNKNGTLAQATATQYGFVWDTSTKALPGDVAPESSGYASSVTTVASLNIGTFKDKSFDFLQTNTYYIRAWTYSGTAYTYGSEVTYVPSYQGSQMMGD